MILRLSTSPLSFATRGDDVAQLQRALQSLGRDVPADERNDRVMGPGTVAVVKALQADLGVPATGVVDAVAVRAINERLAKFATDPRVVRGTVVDANGNPYADGFVQAFALAPAGEQVVGKSPLNAADGSYAITYQPPTAGNGRVDLRVAVLKGAGVVDTNPAGTSILTNAGPLEVVDFVVSAVGKQPLSEFELMLADLKPLLGSRKLADLLEDATHRDISLLAAQSGYSSEQVAALVLAHKLEQGTGVPAAVYYGLVRQQMPADRTALLRVHPDVRRTALRAAVAQQLVPAALVGKKIEDYLEGITPAAPASELGPLLGRILNASDLNKFVGQFTASSQDVAGFWKKVAADPTWANRAAELKFTVQLAALTNNHLPLVNKLKARPDIKQASDLAHLTEADWIGLIQSQEVGLPTETPGTSANEKTQNYARQIIAQVEAAFPALFLAERLGPSRVASFLKSQPAYDFHTTYPARFFKENPAAANALSEDDRRQLLALHRMHRLTGNAAEAIGLAKKGVGSAAQVARLGRAAFAESHNDILTPDRAVAVYEQALRTSAQALALYGEHASGFNRTSMHALPRLDSAAQAAHAVDSIPDWETLFGAFDLCACSECASVHGPAAYLVDLLQFLGDRGARIALFARRPDLGEIELSCANTNTPMPLIDLANEALEDAVAPPAPFAPFTLTGSLEADLGQATATSALGAAFTPALRPGARVEVLAAGTRWRVWDEPYAYSVVKDAAGLKVSTRSRQTSGTPEDRHATPQYRNAAAYDILSQAVYPWTLPFDLPAEEMSACLALKSLSRADLIAALRPAPEPFDPGAPVPVQLAAERLGLTDTERKIIVGALPRQPEDFWGGAASTILTTVQELLDRAGLAYADLEALLATWFINPSGAVAITAKDGAPVATCDTTRLQILSLTSEVLDRLHRFVRLWRKLGWTISEVDQSLRAFAPAENPPALTNPFLVWLDHLSLVRSALSISVAQTLALWKRMDVSGPRSLYRSLFYNPAVFMPWDEAFRLNADETDLLHTDELVNHTAALQAVLLLNPASFAILAGRTNGKLTLDNLSFLYRHALLARQLALPVQDLVTAIDLTGIDPFAADKTQDTQRFLDVVRALRRSGFGIRQLDYLLRHRFNSEAAFVPTEASLAQTLTDIRTALFKVDAATDADQAAQEHSAIVDRLASALTLPADVTSTLLTRISHFGATTLVRLQALSAIPDSTLPLSRGNAQAQFESLEKLLKVAAVLQMVQLPASRLDWLFRECPWLETAPDVPATSVPLTNWYALVQLRLLRLDLGLSDAAVEAVLSAVDVVATATDPPSQLAAKRGFADALGTWQGWAPDALQTLLGKSDDLADAGLLNARIPAAFRGLDLILRLHRAMDLLKWLGVTAALAGTWCEASVTAADAAAIRGAVKASYQEDAWLQVVTPVQDALRDKQRLALTSYLTARPTTGAAGLVKANADDLFSYFLIDVEMTSCQLTSRIKQAIASVQLFAQRCLLGLEPSVQTTDTQWQQWQWMKSFRVWEANRKVWLYPENWLEPELRDDKTPFFTDLENELLQSDLDDAGAEQALRHYLDKLDEVARLEIVGVYEDDEDHTLHVFGRTHHTPHAYYYRRRQGATSFWTPWEKLDLDIEGDHLIPVVWNRRPMVIWPIFTEKTTPKDVEMPKPGNTLKSGDPYWEIQLAWSEYQDGRWSAKNLSEPVTFAAYPGNDAVQFDGQVVPAPPLSVAFLARRGNDAGSDPPPPGNNNGGGGDEGPLHRSANSSAATPRLVSKELIVFKALFFGDTLVVRGFLRRDFRAAPSLGDTQIACPIGDFQFVGCRKLIQTVHYGAMARRNFPLAPKGTKFDRMGFTQAASGLVMFDGQFPTSPVIVVPTAPNDSASIAGDPSATVNAKIDLPVLKQTASPVQLLAPHQDLQFIGDRPFFFMDSMRTFMVTSTGSSGKLSRPDLGDWVNANLGTAWRAGYFPPDPAGPSGTNVEPAAAPPSVLVPGPAGTRIARKMVPVTTTQAVARRTLLPIFWSTRTYRFANFHHPYVCDFEKALAKDGVPGLLSFDAQSRRGAPFANLYQPEARVQQEYPIDEVDFQSGGAYECYNWELFFHIPLLIANRLRGNQRFQEAQRWFQFIFDPTGASGGTVPQRYWRTRPFHDRLDADYAAESVKAIEEMIAGGPPDAWKVAVDIWRNNPFRPHAVARLRASAYQKNVVMKYLDNLIGWADQLFRRDTLEAINEATQHYVLAAELLGRRPEIIERNLAAPVETFNTIEPRLGILGNALEQIEFLVGPADSADAPATTGPAPSLPTNGVLYFCVPENATLQGYWDTVADRLFKIRHCMNIEGQVRQLPLFEPPIDPALLVRAQATGMSLGAVLSDISARLPNYRFAVMVQKTNELVAEVRNLGAALLSALEKGDAEALSTLRSGQEVRLLQAVRAVRAKQVDEANANIESLQRARDLAQARKDYYDGLDYTNEKEAAALVLAELSQVYLVTKAASDLIAVPLSLLPDAKAGSPTTIGVTFGGSQLNASNSALGSFLRTLAEITSASASQTGTLGSYDRRQDEWKHQANLATIELKQIDQQLAGAKIRLAIAEQELRNHEQQSDDARAVDQLLRDKFTNQDLFQWTIGQVSGLYFQSYQLAYDLAKRSELCMQHELGLEGETSFIKFGYWDSLRKGLLAGDHLAFDLKRLEAAYLDRNVREYELTKHISLVSLAPEQFLALKESGTCEFEVPEWLFDLDTPGHYRRRIKMASVTIPCVTGPYTSIHCKLQLLKHSYRRSTDVTMGYERRTSDDPSSPDPRFIDDPRVLESVVTSTAQNDAGLFEPILRDERYLPFEGAGAVSRWRLELPTQFRLFNFDTISDVILHLRYTAADGGATLGTAAGAAGAAFLKRTDTQPLFRLFSLRHEFPSEWRRFALSSATGVRAISVDLAVSRFPYFVQGRNLNITLAKAIAIPGAIGSIQIGIAPGPESPELTQDIWTGQSGTGTWTIATSTTVTAIDDILVVIGYSVN